MSCEIVEFHPRSISNQNIYKYVSYNIARIFLIKILCIILNQLTFVSTFRLLLCYCSFVHLKKKTISDCQLNWVKNMS